MSLESFKTSIVALVMVSLIIAGMAIANDAFQDSIEDDGPCVYSGVYTTAFNTTTGLCQNTSTHAALGTTNYQYNVTQEGNEGLSNASSYLSTIGTLIGVAALIAIVIGAFMFVRR